jgi:hypothetical protein
MALSRGRLTNQVVQVGSGTTVGIVTVSNSKKIYVKSITAHNTSGVTTSFAQINYVPNGQVSGTTNRIFNISVDPNETILIEPSYPIVLTSTGDSLTAFSSATTTNILMSGDQEV